jgi:hypothetical protein
MDLAAPATLSRRPCQCQPARANSFGLLGSELRYPCSGFPLPLAEWHLAEGGG